MNAGAHRGTRHDHEKERNVKVVVVSDIEAVNIIVVFVPFSTCPPVCLLVFSSHRLPTWTLVLNKAACISHALCPPNAGRVIPELRAGDVTRRAAILVYKAANGGVVGYVHDTSL
jgi:hypothetical protein